MKARKKTKRRVSKSKNNKKPRSSARRKTKSMTHSRIQTPRSTDITTNPLSKTCQEVEVGDIGGFGSMAELEEHERRCNEPATDFCTNCGRNLCHNHYDLLHRDHDSISRQTMGQTAA